MGAWQVGCGCGCREGIGAELELASAAVMGYGDADPKTMDGESISRLALRMTDNWLAILQCYRVKDLVFVLPSYLLALCRSCLLEAL
jgi:hypothetical protein